MRSFLAFAIFLTSQSSIATELISFDLALKTLMDKNLEVQSSDAHLKKVKAAQIQSYANFFPSVSISATDSQVTELPISKSVTKFSHSQQGLLMGEINLFRGFADWAGFQGGEALITSAKHNYSQAVLNAEQTSIELLVNYIKSALIVKVSRNVLQLNENLNEIQNARYKRGLVPLQETQKAAIERDNSLARLRDAEVEFQSAKSKLQHQLGTQPQLHEDWPWLNIFNSQYALDTISSKIDMKSQRSPRLQSAESQLQVQAFERKSKFRNFMPTLDLAVGYGFQDYLTADKMGWQTQLVLKIPLFDLTKHSNYRSQVQEEQLAKIRLETEKRLFQTELQASREQLKLAIESAKRREQSRKMALSLYEDNQRRLRAGRSSMNDILVDQNRLTQAEILAISGWAETHTTYSRYCHSQGLRVNTEKFGCRE